jgi:hypothetical protein
MDIVKLNEYAAMHKNVGNPWRLGGDWQKELTPKTISSIHIFYLTSTSYVGESVGVRTRDLLIKSQLLYQLSYALPCSKA